MGNRASASAPVQHGGDDGLNLPEHLLLRRRRAEGAVEAERLAQRALACGCEMHLLGRIVGAGGTRGAKRGVEKDVFVTKLTLSDAPMSTSSPRFGSRDTAAASASLGGRTRANTRILPCGVSAGQICVSRRTPHARR